jgi:hypothetical protein
MFKKIPVPIVETEGHRSPQPAAGRRQPWPHIVQGRKLVSQQTQDTQLPGKSVRGHGEPFIPPVTRYTDSMVCKNAEFVHGKTGFSPFAESLKSTQSTVNPINPINLINLINQSSINSINIPKLYTNPNATASRTDLQTRQPAEETLTGGFNWTG